jgi:outer membrane protein assembly factor BamD
MKKIHYIILLVGLVAVSCTSKFGKIQKSKDNEYKYKMAEQYYAKKKYSYASQLFEDLFPWLKGKQGFEDMYLKFAYCYYYQRDYMNSESLFKSFVETFPSSPKAEEAEFMRAYSFYKQSPKVDLDQSNTTKTIGQMQAFINTHPTSSRVKEASDIIDLCRAKLEQKEYKGAELYYNLGYFRAAAIAFATLIDNFPDSEKADQYKLSVIKSYFKYAEMSVEEKQVERFDKVISECVDFNDRFPESKLKNEVDKFKLQSQNFIKNNKNEQTKKAD